MKSSVSEWVAVVGQKGLESDDDTELHRAANEKQIHQYLETVQFSHHGPK